MLVLFYVIIVKKYGKGGKSMRKYYIDNIRSLTIVLVVIYHVIYIFNSIITDGVIGPVTKAHGVDAVQYLLYPWFMVILFIISGMCSRYYLERHTVKEYIRARTRKLLVPSTIGILVFGWAQGYFNMEFSHAFDNMPAEVPGAARYFIMCLSGTGVLWTIQVMWILSMVLLVVRKIEKGHILEAGKKTGIILLILFSVPVWLSAQILNTPVIAVYRFGIYGISFLLGYYVFSHEAVTDKLKKYCIPLLFCACLLGVIYVWRDYGKNYAVAPDVNSPLAVAYGWMMCLAVLGCIKKWGNRSGRVSRFMAAKSFGLYVFHYLALSACAYYLTTYTDMPGVAIYLITAVAAFAGALILYEIISRIPVLRWCILGIKKKQHEKSI